MRRKTRKQAKLEFHKSGVSIAGWAVENGFNPTLVYMVLSGKRAAVRGQSHRIAVALGLKNGAANHMPL
jgi:gp16 family phage-associated protein